MKRRREGESGFVLLFVLLMSATVAVVPMPPAFTTRIATSPVPPATSSTAKARALRGGLSWLTRSSFHSR